MKKEKKFQFPIPMTKFRFPIQKPGLGHTIIPTLPAEMFGGVPVL